MRRLPRFLILGALTAALAFAVVGCNGDDDSSSQTDPSSTPSGEPAEGLTPLDEIEITLTPIAPIEGGTAIATRAGDDRLFVAQQEGRVVTVDPSGDGDAETILDISSDVRTSIEQGLIGLAFSPDGDRLYVHFSDSAGDTVIDEYAFGDDGVDEESRRTILTVDQPDERNHKGGKIAFGPDGMLWIGLGDGGGQGDPNGNGQDTSTLLATILRIDPSQGDPYAIPEDNPFVDGGGEPEIWAYGLRNPWQFSFDSETGDLWIGDVGQSAWEEINFAPAPDRGRGANYGWSLREGTHEFTGDAPEGAVDPVFEHPNPAEGCSVTGGVVYRGSAVPALRGVYVYSDLCITDLRALRLGDDGGVEAATVSDDVVQVVAFGEGPDGELYFLSYADGLFRIDPA